MKLLKNFKRAYKGLIKAQLQNIPGEFPGGNSHIKVPGMLVGNLNRKGDHCGCGSSLK